MQRGQRSQYAFFNLFQLALVYHSPKLTRKLISFKHFILEKELSSANSKNKCHCDQWKVNINLRLTKMRLLNLKTNVMRI